MGSGALAWRPKGAAPPKGRFQWDAASEEALLALGCAQLSLQEKEGEWSKLPSQLLRKPILHGTWRRPATHLLRVPSVEPGGHLVCRERLSYPPEVSKPVSKCACRS